MKNHVMVDGKLLQTNKKFSALKERQKLGFTKSHKRSLGTELRVGIS